MCYSLFCLLAPTDVEETEVLGFFESLEKERAEAEMAKMLEQKKIYPIAPDGKMSLNYSHLKTASHFFSGFIPNSTIRAMFKMKEIEPIDAKIFRLRLVCI